MNLFSKIAAAKKVFSTYNIGLTQTKAYRAMKNRTDELLKVHGISSVDWAFLGLLYDNKQGLQFSAIAETLGVEASFITSLVEKLSEKKLLTQSTLQSDRRAKRLCLTEHGRKLVPEIESKLRKGMKPLIDGIPLTDIYIYYKVLNEIVKNSEQG